MEYLAELLKKKLSEQSDEEINRKWEKLDSEFDTITTKMKEGHAMTEKEQCLLYQDLCARLLHGVKCALYSKYFSHPKMGQVVRIDARMENIIVLEENFDMPVTYGTRQVKPYLRPLEDMTESERSLYNDLRNALTYQENGEYDLDDFNELNDFLNRNHLDYRGLIPMGLAIKVTKENNPYKN